MRTNPSEVIFDSGVAPAILSILNDAQTRVTLVTPYIDLDDWRHASDALDAALRRGVAVTLFIRDEPRQVEKAEVARLLEAGARVFAVEGLHAKIYLNEAATLLSSMNLTESSQGNSHETAWRIADGPSAQAVQSYIDRTLTPKARELRKPGLLRRLQTEVPASIRTVVGGHCIRCGGSIPLDPGHPLCDECYKSWVQHRNLDYKERQCHMCGKRRVVTYAKLLCDRCFEADR